MIGVLFFTIVLLFLYTIKRLIDYVGTIRIKR